MWPIRMIANKKIVNFFISSGERGRQTFKKKKKKALSTDSLLLLQLIFILTKSRRKDTEKEREREREAWGKRERDERIDGAESIVSELLGFQIRLFSQMRSGPSLSLTINYSHFLQHMYSIFFSSQFLFFFF